MACGLLGTEAKDLTQRSWDAGRGSRPAQLLSGLFPAGHCAAMPVSQEYVSCEGWLHPVWLSEATAHVPHGDARNDQPDFVHR